MTQKLKDHLINCSDVEFTEWIRTASPRDVRFVSLDGVFHNGAKGWIIEQELRARAADKHHWTLTPVFVIGFLAMIFAGIAAWPVARDWIWPPVAKKSIQNEVAPVPTATATPTPSITPPIASTPTPVQVTPSPAATPKLARRHKARG